MSPREDPEVVPSAAGLGAGFAAESGIGLGERIELVAARGYWELVWLRFKRDKAALVSGVFIVFLLIAAFAGPPVAKRLLGHGPNEVFIGTDAVSTALLPANPWTWIDREKPIDKPPYVEKQRQLLILGASNRLGQDEFLRLLYGSRASLEVALLSTLGVLLIGVVLGVFAGYFGGWIDGLIWRVTEVTMVFPVLLFVISLAATAGRRLDRITLGGVFPPGVITLVLIFTLFGWFYPARIVRAQVFAIRERDYVDAARMVGPATSGSCGRTSCLTWSLRSSSSRA